ncbi:CHAT domain-containing protein [Mycena pura]|uniref:CHAT domain-containing protein n=1 Tax=Mycena pura TaxID=153505 RepID=A0AAD6UPA5_9AGAR|nr:CHAT domain-containing protein [Mycena pura]
MLTPEGHPDKPSCYNNLGTSLRRRFNRLGDLDDLNQSVLRYQTALMLTPEGHPEKLLCYNNLGISLRRRFQRLGDLNDLTQSVLRFEAAVRLTPQGHPHKPLFSNSLGNALLSRYERHGDLDDLNECVLRFEAAVMLTPEGHPDKPLCYSNLGISLRIRFERLDDLNDLNQSVLRHETAVRLTSEGHPDKPTRHNNLGASLFRRFDRLGDLDDLNQSVLRFEAALMLTPDGHPHKPILYDNLGTSLAYRFKRLGDLDGLNRAVSSQEASIRLTADDDPSKPRYYNNLGHSLHCRFELLGDLTDINQSVSSTEAAVRLTPEDHPDKPVRYINLANALGSRFERHGDLDDINQSVLRLETALMLAPDNHPTNSLLLFHLGVVHIRFQAATLWAKHAQIHHHPSILHAYTTAIDLLPELAWLGLSMSDRYHHILQAGQVVRDAASAAIVRHDYQKAVEWLDQGRSVIWAQLLTLRTPVDDLKESHPDLAAQLISLSTSLETGGTQSGTADGIQSQSPQSIAENSHALALERNHLLQRIRELPEFERFLLPKSFFELSLAAKMGPVAMLNISQYGCDALILMPGLADEPIHVPLPDITLNDAQSLAKSLASIVGGPGRSDRLDGFHEGDMPPDDIFSHILSELWFKIVQPVLIGIAVTTPASQDLGRIWWCPTGPLAFLPIHAAGLYHKDETFGSKLSDFLISSYTPSLTALIQGFRRQSESQEEFKLLTVTQPSAQGQCYIPGTQEEIKCIRQHATGRVPVLWLDEHMATIDNVQKGMTDSSWVHFACHGVQRASSPTDSALLLAGSSRLTLSNIIQLSLPQADLAFLSACQTATGSKDFEDESVHLAAGMLFAGYRSVIGTMWSIMDNDAPQVASNVYAHLFEASPPDSTRAAEALHLAVEKLREQPGVKKSFLHWVPFIHFGV